MKHIGSTWGQSYSGIVAFRMRYAAHAVKRSLGMMPGDYGFWLTLARWITGSSGCVAGRWSWSR